MVLCALLSSPLLMLAAVIPATSQAASPAGLSALCIDAQATPTLCRSVPFLAAAPEARGDTTRRIDGGREIIPVGAQASALYLLGMINDGWDFSVAHWGEHPELMRQRNDQVHIGSRLGDIELRYADGTRDLIPVVMGATAWWANQWAHGPTHSYPKPVMEPFASRPDYMAVLRSTLRLREQDCPCDSTRTFAHFYLPVEPRPKVIDSIVVIDNPALRGRPLLAAVTLAAVQSDRAHAARLQPLDASAVDPADLAPTIRSAAPGDWSGELERLAALLYTSPQDLPARVEPVAFPAGLDAARMRFIGTGPLAGMLSNMWTANLAQIAAKFSAETGIWLETGEKTPWYGGYQGLGTWAPVGVYRECYSRTADHYVTLALRCLHDARRCTSFVDYADTHLYFYRANRDPRLGPPNDQLEINRYPADAPPHWSFIIERPLVDGPQYEINEIAGNEETDGHGATAVARWYAWRQLGAPTGEWLTAPRAQVYGKSRWDSTVDAAEFICWLMDYTGMDVIWCEGEGTGWGGWGRLVPPGMREETDPVKIRRNYANAEQYEVYPAMACMTALRCSAEMAEALGDGPRATRWRAYADRVEAAMRRQLRVGSQQELIWRACAYSVWPSQMESLAPAFFSIYHAGQDTSRWPAEFEGTTRTTLDFRLRQRSGHAPVLGMGYGQGWLTHAALALDELDDAGKLLTNLAHYCYDKNMDYADPTRGIDWRPWLWIVPEGTNLLPSGQWHRLGDLSNGANQGPVMHALEACAGVDDSNPHDLRILPRVPTPLTGIEVDNWPLLYPLAARGDTPSSATLGRARIHFSFNRAGGFQLTSDVELPNLSVRLGPFPSQRAAAQHQQQLELPAGAHAELNTTGTDGEAPAWWLWIRGLRDVRELTL